ncbi:MAG: carboxypeptidase regulatory-like domain-containing protein [Armatimonadetes bacterium]|nr:carboxypeptidase regulatory-like domain-containing protein [Armatimonadota bacterium]
MRRAWTILLVAILAGIIGLTGCGSEFDHGSVKGRIVSAVDGTPIAGAAVFIGSENDVTDASGLYAIEGINTGRKDMVIRKQGYILPGDIVSVNVIKGVVELGDIGLVPVSDQPPGSPVGL